MPISGNVCLTPYADSRTTQNAATNLTPTWINPKTFQILCCGLDGLYSYPTNNTSPGNVPLSVPLWGFYPLGVNYATQSMDDITNFTTGATLADDMSP